MSKIKLKKRIKDYPPNVPRKLFLILKSNNFNRSLTAKTLGVNGGYVSNLLNKGIEPPDTTKKGREIRKKLFLKVHKQSQAKVNRTIQNPKPHWKIVWDHLSKEERDNVKITYIEWKEKNK